MWISSMLRDGVDGSLSSKRVITFSAFTLCAIAFIANLFFDVDIEKFIYDSMSYIAMAGLGVTVAEKFAGKPTYDTQTQNYYQQTVTQPMPPIDQYRSTYPRRGTPLPQQKDPLI